MGDKTEGVNVWNDAGFAWVIPFSESCGRPVSLEPVQFLVGITWKLFRVSHYVETILKRKTCEGFRG
jgi:hypothetical protein